MADSNLSGIAGFDTERTVSGPFTGSFQTLGSILSHNPVILIFDNQSTVSCEISVDGVKTWKTFPAGEAMILDLRANHGIASTYAININTQFYVKGTGGTGLFSIAILYAQ